MNNKLWILFFFIPSFHSLNAQHHKDSHGGYADSVNAGIIKTDTMRGSPHRVAMANIGDAHIHIEYGSPGVKGRMIWGGLVAFDRVWATGAHNATSINFSRNVKWGGKSIPAGTYGLFTIPGKDKWIVILNKNSKMHLADDYDEKEDLARIEVKPEALDRSIQRLTYIVTDKGNKKGAVQMQWDKIQVSIPVEPN